MSDTTILPNASALDDEKNCIYQTDLQIPDVWSRILNIHNLNNQIDIGCWNGQTDTNWETHSEGPATFCISIMLEGHLQAAFDNGSVLDLKSGMFALMSTKQRASGWDTFIGNGNFRMVDIRLSHETLAQLTSMTDIQIDDVYQRKNTLNHPDAFMGGLSAPVDLLRTAQNILSINIKNDAVKNLYLYAKALEATAITLKKLALDDKKTVQHIPADKRRLMDAKRLLENSYDKNWSIPILSQAVGLNEKRLQNGFQHLFNTSVHAYLTKVRMQAAIQMLAKEISVTETAYMVGFSSLSHFSKVFRTFTGMTPKQWMLQNTMHNLEHS